MPTSNDLLFVYGTLRQAFRHPMSEVLASFSVAAGDGHIYGDLYDLGSFPGVVLSTNCQNCVFGELRAINPDQVETAWQALDDYEECTPTFPGPHLYERRNVRVTLADGTEVEAWAYILQTLHPGAIAIPGGDYLEWCQTAKSRAGQQRDVPS